jgi:hypothetical protein
MKLMTSEGFGAAEHDAVRDDQADEDRQLLAGLEGIRLQELVDENHERRDDRHEDDDADVVRDPVAQCADRGAGEGRNTRQCDTHQQCGQQRGRDSQRRTDAEHLQRDRVVIDYRVDQDFACFRH